MVFGAIILMWIFILTYMISAAVLTSDIVDGTYVVGSYDGNVQEKAANLLSLLIAYLMPIAICVFCYSRIVDTLRYKVNSCTIKLSAKVYCNFVCRLSYENSSFCF